MILASARACSGQRLLGRKDLARGEGPPIGTSLLDLDIAVGRQRRGRPATPNWPLFLACAKSEAIPISPVPAGLGSQGRMRGLISGSTGRVELGRLADVELAGLAGFSRSQTGGNYEFRQGDGIQ